MPDPALLERHEQLVSLLDEPFYALHAWAWQHDPLGIFANWNPLIGCDHGATAAH